MATVYLSCMKGRPDPATNPNMVVCKGDDGLDWWLDSEASSDPAWLKFIEDGGVVTDYEPPETPS